MPRTAASCRARGQLRSFLRCGAGVPFSIVGRFTRDVRQVFNLVRKVPTRAHVSVAIVEYGPADLADTVEPARRIATEFGPTALGAGVLPFGHDDDAPFSPCWPGMTSVSDLCQTGSSPAVSTLKPYS